MVFAVGQLGAENSSIGTVHATLHYCTRCIAHILWDNPTNTYVRRKIGHVGTTLASLSHVWTDRQQSLSTKLRLNNSPVPSFLLYAAETWTLCSNLERRLDAFNTSCLCKIADLRWYQWVSSAGSSLHSHQFEQSAELEGCGTLLGPIHPWRVPN
ncbi:uncharacterized protein AKAME5_001479600 [Lates japonicus]|uniref:Uncharacterized protein n=1 Tax=Lates japonicus TaxID=270547 RepID=A0AAD3RAF4_LATJO|nr:uncharacterized protein AKAME5_001479600 [Lates japonicus]